MDIGKLAEFSIGLAAFLGGLWIILLIIRTLRSDRNGTPKSAGLTANEWKTEIRKALKDALGETAPQRYQELAVVIERVLDHKFLQRDERIKELLAESTREIIGEWLDKRLGQR